MWGRFIQIAFLSLLASTASYSQQIVSGRIIARDTDLPLEEATIQIKGQPVHTHSGLDGRFTITLTKPTDTLYITHIGYDPKTIVWNQQLVKEPTIYLLPAPVQLSQVVVQDSRRALQQVMQIDLKTNPVNSAQDILRKVPGLFIGQHAGGGKAEQLFLRGFDIDHGTDIRITTDGMPVNMVSHAHGQGYADLHYIIPETIKDIQFGKGSYYAEEGDFATAGYVNFTTHNRLDRNLLKLEAGQFNTLRTVGMFNLFEKTGEKNSNAYIAGEYLFSNGPFEAPQNFNRLNFLAKYNTQINQKSSLQVLASTFNSKWDASGQIPDRAVRNGLITRWGAIDATEGGNTSRSNIAAKYRSKISDTEDWQSNFYFSQYDFSLFSNFTFFLEDPVNGDQIHQSEKRKIYGMDHRYTKQLFGDKADWVLTAGMGLRHDAVRDIQLSHTLQRKEVLEYFALGDIDQTNASLYGSAEWRKGHWKVIPGIRLDHFIFNYVDKLQPVYSTQAAQKTILSPKLNLVYTPHANWQGYLKMGKGFHSNDTRVVVAQQGREILPATYGADLGAIVKLHPKLLVQPAIWYLYMEQEFVYVGDAAIVEPSGKTRRLGAELGIRYQPFSWLYLDADINYAKARAIEETKGNDFIPLAPSFTSTGGISVRPVKRLDLNWRYRYMKDRPANEDNSIQAQGYFVNDLLINYTRTKWALGLQVENLFDTYWREAQFETESRLRNEAAPVSEIHYTPGTPFFARIKWSLFF